MAIAKICGWVALGLAGVILQGMLVFWWRGYAGSFLSETGFECAAIPTVAEIVLLVLVIRNIDELQAGFRANPHSPLGQSLRNEQRNPPPPAARDAWDGGFAAPDQAAEDMRKDR